MMNGDFILLAVPVVIAIAVIIGTIAMISRLQHRGLGVKRAGLVAGLLLLAAMIVASVA